MADKSEQEPENTAARVALWRAIHVQQDPPPQPGPQAWKRKRLEELGFGVPSHLHLVPVDFEAGQSWLQLIAAEGFAANKPAVVASTGVSMYLSKEAVSATLREVAGLAQCTTLVMSFMLPIDQAEAEVRASISNRPDGMRLPNNSEELLVART
jgi:O-methyltransferase involved in polyketide biosynthesis